MKIFWKHKWKCVFVIWWNSDSNKRVCTPCCLFLWCIFFCTGGDKCGINLGGTVPNVFCRKLITSSASLFFGMISFFSSELQNAMNLVDISVKKSKKPKSQKLSIRVKNWFSVFFVETIWRSGSWSWDRIQLWNDPKLCLISTI